MDKTLERIYSITPEQAQEYNQYVMLGNGNHGICFEKGKGVRLWDINGKSYLDCTSQGWAMYLGHANEEIRQTVYEHMGNLGHPIRTVTIWPATLWQSALSSLLPKA